MRKISFPRLFPSSLHSSGTHSLQPLKVYRQLLTTHNISFFRREIGSSLEDSKDGGFALPELVGLSPSFSARKDISVDDEPMLPSLTPLAGEFLR